mgnify:CR=1 FL=1
MCREREILLVELQLLVPGEPLPWGGVSEGWEPELLVLQLLGDGQPLARAQTQPRELTEVSLGHSLEQPPPGVSTQPLRGPLIPGEGGGGGERSSCESSLEGADGSC